MSTAALTPPQGRQPPPMTRPIARTAHGALTPPAEYPQPKPDVFVGRPVTHSAVSPTKDVVPKLHADPCLQPLGGPGPLNVAGSPSAPPPVNVMSFISSMNDDEARMVHETRAQYENIISEQRRKSSFSNMRSSNDSLGAQASPSPRSQGQTSPKLFSDEGELLRPQPSSILKHPGHRRRISNEAAAPTVPVQGGRFGSPGRMRQQQFYPNPPPPIPPDDSSRASDSDLPSNDAVAGGVRDRVGKARKKAHGGKRRHLRGQGRIKVVVRKRPLNAAGPEGGEDVVTTMERAIIVNEHKERIDLSKYTEKQTFQFDEVFHDSHSNKHVFEGTARPLLDTFFEGGSASCFAYGQTGSGKTHTMLGHRGEPGLYLLAAQQLFERLTTSQSIMASFYEIYCDKLYDLLNGRKQLFPREDAHKKVNIVGLTEHAVGDLEMLLKLMDIAAKQRSSGATAANELSSRSHAILCLTMQDEEDVDMYASFKFIDLAGSERGADTAERGRKTQQEGAEINKSLLALKECIRGLDMGHQHIKFRGSKLTEVLRDSFTGNCRTVMIATLSPSSNNVEHSLNTLRYAHRVKGLPMKNIGPSEARNQPRRRSTSAGLQAEEPSGGAGGRAARNKGARQERRRAKSVPVQQDRLAQQQQQQQPPTPNSPADSSDDGLDDYNLPRSYVAKLRGKMAQHKRQAETMQEEVQRLKKELREKEAAHRQEIGMCKMVKRMDEQRILLLEDHNATLQKKVQELSK